MHKSIKELDYILEHISKKNYVEFYHDAIEYHDELFTLFNLGYVTLRERAAAEELFHRICRKALFFSSFERKLPDEFEALQKLKVSKYLANFSIFQSIPDAWSIDQLFPVIPLSRHDEKPSHKATIVDITCDSDGCIEHFVDSTTDKSLLDLHSTIPGQPYLIGFFLVGAYQESLANEHNLFGAINEVEASIDKDGIWKIDKVTKGDPIDELLACRNYDIDEIRESFTKQVGLAQKSKLVDERQGQYILDSLQKYLSAYPYLRQLVD
ncbi:MAG: hypothetical protein R3B45_07390 [Bdellovibrionota bacterium]